MGDTNAGKKALVASMITAAGATFLWYSYRSRQLRELEKDVENVQYGQEVHLAERESLWAKGYIHSGGKVQAELWCDEAVQACSASNEEREEEFFPIRALVVGCGAGGPSLYMAQHHGVSVWGYDKCKEVVQRAKELCEFQETPTFVLPTFTHTEDFTQEPIETPFDMVWLVEPIYRYGFKGEALFKKVYDVLRPGGTVFIVDHCCNDEGIGACSMHFSTFVQSRFLDLCTISEYRSRLQAAGLEVAACRDNTELMMQLTTNELLKMDQVDSAGPRSSPSFHQDFRDLWEGKKKWLAKDLRFVVLHAKRPN